MKHNHLNSKLDREISNHLSLYRGASQWAVFRAISSSTISWLVTHRPTRTSVVSQLSVNPEQLFNVVSFCEESASLTHSSTWAQLALVLYCLKEDGELNDASYVEQITLIDAENILSTLLALHSSQTTNSELTQAAIEQLYKISYTSRIPTHFKKKQTPSRPPAFMNYAIHFVDIGVNLAIPPSGT